MVGILLTFLILFSVIGLRSSFLEKHLLKVAALGSAGWFCYLMAMGVTGLPPVEIPVMQDLGVWLSLRSDGLTWTFGALVLFIGAFVFLYADGYLQSSKKRSRFLFSLFLFSGAMLGLVFSDNIFSFFLFWELTSLSSYLLITDKDSDAKTRQAGHQVFFLTLVGGFFLLAGLLWMQQVGLQNGLTLFEASHFSSLLSLPWPDFEAAPWIFILLLIGAGSKSAQFPFHVWLPQAMAAPTPVSSFLHSATMVKAGIFLLAKIYVGFHLLPIWPITLIPLGLFTALLTAVYCLSAKDLKEILAWTTVSVLGILTMLLGLGTELALKSFVVFLFAHALYKASLFQVAGNIDKATGTRQLDEVFGLYTFMKLTAIGGVLAALSKAGAPPFLGFIGKELILKTQIGLPAYEAPLLILAVIINASLMVMALMVGIKPFLKNRKAPQKKMTKLKTLPQHMHWSPFLLGAFGLAVGLVPSLFDQHLGEPMVAAIAGKDLSMDLMLWHGLKPSALLALAISIFTFGLGAVLLLKFRSWSPHTRFIYEGIPAASENLRVAFEKTMAGLYRLSEIKFKRSVSTYLVFLGFLFVLCFGALFVVQGSYDRVHFPSVATLMSEDLAILSLLVLVTAATSVAVLFSTRFVVGAIMLGLIGMGVAVIFAWYGAPDLAMTQILAELLLAVLIANFGFRLKRLPDLSREHYWMPRTILSILFGGCVFLITQSTLQPETNFVARDYYLASSLEEAFGKNIVNVILVDFRALDTLNEVFVVFIAGVGVALVLGLKSRSKKKVRPRA